MKRKKQKMGGRMEPLVETGDADMICRRCKRIMGKRERERHSSLERNGSPLLSPFLLELNPLAVFVSLFSTFLNSYLEKRQATGTSGYKQQTRVSHSDHPNFRMTRPSLVIMMILMMMSITNGDTD